jgi:hypothetical protein
LVEAFRPGRVSRLSLGCMKDYPLYSADDQERWPQ